MKIHANRLVNIPAWVFGAFLLSFLPAQAGRALGGYAEAGMDQAATALGAAIAAGFGLFGNGLMEPHLRNRGYRPQATVSAGGLRSARKKFLSEPSAE
ncbi:MAG: hypothetical protein ACLFRG_04930 [Desulfococcaceae bacterium]